MVSRLGGYSIPIGGLPTHLYAAPFMTELGLVSTYCCQIFLTNAGTSLVHQVLIFKN